MARTISRALFIWLALCLQNHIEALTFIEQPSNTTIIEDAADIILKCSVDKPSATLYWFKDGQLVVQDYKHLTEISDGLRISNPKRGDSGVYYCQAKDKSETITSGNATLTVSYICQGSQFEIKASEKQVFKGFNVTLTCGCDGVPEPNYEWKKDNQPIGNGKQLQISSASTSNGGTYVCSAVNNVNTVSPYSSNPYNLVVVDGVPPQITVKPKSNIYFIPNSEVMMNCQATGDPQPDIFWYFKKDSTPLKNTSDQHVFQNGSLHFSDVTPVNAGVYTCQAKNTYSKSDKFKSKLTQAKIGPIPAIDEKLFRLGSSMSILCNPPNAMPKVNGTMWRYGDGQPIPLSDSRVKSVKNTLIIEQTKKSDSGTYECVAKNMAGVETLKVMVTIAIYPKVVEDPTNQTVIEGKTAKLQCKVTGSPAPTIAWVKDGIELTDSDNYQINGAILIIPKVKVENNGLYRCTATLDKISERSKVAELKVREKIYITDPGSVKLDAGKVGKIICLITGEKPWNITWSKIGLPERLLSHMHPEGHVLYFRQPKLTDSGNYTCMARNSFSKSSTTITVNVYIYPVFVIKPKNVTVKVDGSVLFDCSLKGYPQPTVLWYRKKKEGSGWQLLKNGTRFKIFNNGSLFLRSVLKEDQLAYRCVGGNAGELITAFAYLKIDTNGGAPSKDSSDNMGKTVGIAVGCAGAYIILVVGLMIYCKSRRARQAKNKLVINGEDIPLNAVDGENVEVVKAPDTKLQFPRQDLEALRTLGSGSYGNVFLAKASGIVEGEATSVVVVQSLTTKDEEIKKDFMKIMEKLSLKHENIAKLLGVCREEEPMYMVSEYPEQGDLKTVMHDSSSPLSATQKLNLCASISSGMNYLTSHDHVHRDLAARNCLVDKCFNVKISFLSLNQGTYPKEYYKHGEELIPLRWMAPEALKGEYNEMTDVWSFGVLMWEIYTEGLLPYDERPDEEVLKCVPYDLRLTKPETCPGKIFKLMEQCWDEEENNRPSFGHLCEDFSEIPRDNEL